MKEKYVIEGDFNGLKYWVQLVDDTFRWNGLLDNATKFASEIMAISIMAQFQNYTILWMEVKKREV